MGPFEVVDSFIEYVYDWESAWQWFLWLPLEWRVIVGIGVFGMVYMAWVFLIATLPDK